MSSFKDVNCENLAVSNSLNIKGNYDMPDNIKIGQTIFEIETANEQMRVSINFGFTLPDTNYFLFYTIRHNSMVEVHHKILYKYQDRFEFYIKSAGTGNYSIEWLVIKQN